MRLRTTYRQPDAARYRRPGGAWDVPTLDALLSSPRPAGRPGGGRRRRPPRRRHPRAPGRIGGRRAAGARGPARRRGRLAAAQLVGGAGPVPGLLAVRRGGRPHPPPGGRGRGGPPARRPRTGGGPEHRRPAPGRPGRRHRGARRRDRDSTHCSAAVPSRPAPWPRVGHRRGAVHLGLDRAPQGRAPHPSRAWPTRPGR